MNEQNSLPCPSVSSPRELPSGPVPQLKLPSIACPRLPRSPSGLFWDWLSDTVIQLGNKPKE